MEELFNYEFLDSISTDSGIYQIINSDTQKRYIGRAINIKNRIPCGYVHDIKYNQEFQIPIINL